MKDSGTGRKGLHPDEFFPEAKAVVILVAS